MLTIMEILCVLGLISRHRAEWQSFSTIRVFCTLFLFLFAAINIYFFFLLSSFFFLSTAAFYIHFTAHSLRVNLRMLLDSMATYTYVATSLSVKSRHDIEQEFSVFVLWKLCIFYYRKVWSIGFTSRGSWVPDQALALMFYRIYMRNYVWKLQRV